MGYPGVPTNWPRYSDLRDLTTTKSLLRERAHQNWYPAQYYNEITPLSALDDIHLEVEESQRQFSPPYTIYMRLKRESHTNELTKWGMDQPINLEVEVPTVILEDAGLVVVNQSALSATTTRTRPGDYFIFNGIRFDVKWCDHFSIFWNQTHYPLFYYIKANRYRADVGGLVDGLYNAGGPQQ